VQQLDDLTSIIERLALVGSFKNAANLLVEWARSFTGCEAATLRLLVGRHDDNWLGGCTMQGTSVSFARDEALMDLSECMCGRVAGGQTNPAYPFFTTGGSFIWGRMSTLSSDFSADETGAIRGRCVVEQYESVVICPIKAGGRIVGSLHLADTRPDYFADTVDVIESVARLAGGVLLRYQAEERDQSLLEAIQSALLPPVPPVLEGLEIGVSFGSATEMARLGGDFYDVIDLGAAGTMILVGDVAGKGLQAAGFAAQARYAMGAQAPCTNGPAEFMALANEALLRILPRNCFVTAVACLIDLERRSIRVCLAGHPSPLHFASRHGAEISAPHNPPLGIFEGAQYEETTEPISGGDILLIYTDGVTESRRDSSQFGVEGILRAMQSAPESNPDQAARTVCAQAAEFHDPLLAGDDRLVMAVKID
jgi:serine phosphatase RsbU (regulator of sigma subunit)